jgi:hypothetical protein
MTEAYEGYIRVAKQAILGSIMECKNALYHLREEFRASPDMGKIEQHANVLFRDATLLHQEVTRYKNDKVLKTLLPQTGAAVEDAGKILKLAAAGTKSIDKISSLESKLYDRLDALLDAVR